jgi:hypothetical protein
VSTAGWFIVLLALAGTSMPFLNQGFFADVNPVRWTGSHAGVVLRRAPELDFREILRQSWKLVEVRKDPGVALALHILQPGLSFLDLLEKPATSC